ncbi:MAG: hypothetical protein A6F71_10820 [Cycloclasticus sp. symbiont of Poecilosclerida sp. M]|nr:MAG: hypothetical protein A6F71_10820 [Cycloclasticus sp. symbiont of Poecilosclerida sp. M]
MSKLCTKFHAFIGKCLFKKKVYYLFIFAEFGEIKIFAEFCIREYLIQLFPFLKVHGTTKQFSVPRRSAGSSDGGT